MANSVGGSNSLFSTEPFQYFAFEQDQVVNDAIDDEDALTSSTDSVSEHDSPQKINHEAQAQPQISPEKFPLRLKLHEKMVYKGGRVPDVARLARLSSAMKSAMNDCTGLAQDTFYKARQARGESNHESANLYDERTRNYVFQYDCAADTYAKVQQVIGSGLEVIPMTKSSSQ